MFATPWISLFLAWLADEAETEAGSPRPHRSGVGPTWGDRVRDNDYGGQRWLYHWTSPERLPQIAEHGLLPDAAVALTPSNLTPGGVFFSTQPDKWAEGHRRVLRALVRDVECVYDGGEWIYEGSEEGLIDGRLADCRSRRPIPASALSVWSDGAWCRLIP